MSKKHNFINLCIKFTTLKIIGITLIGRKLLPCTSLHPVPPSLLLRVKLTNKWHQPLSWRDRKCHSRKDQWPQCRSTTVWVCKSEPPHTHFPQVSVPQGPYLFPRICEKRVNLHVLSVRDIFVDRWDIPVPSRRVWNEEGI